jgi:hypothetical protein
MSKELLNHSGLEHLTRHDQHANSLEELFDFDRSGSLHTTLNQAVRPTFDCTPDEPLPTTNQSAAGTGRQSRFFFRHSKVSGRGTALLGSLFFEPRLPHSNSSITISGFDPKRSGGPHVPAPLDVNTCILPIRLNP